MLYAKKIGLATWFKTKFLSLMIWSSESGSASVYSSKELRIPSRYLQISVIDGEDVTIVLEEN